MSGVMPQPGFPPYPAESPFAALPGPSLHHSRPQPPSVFIPSHLPPAPLEPLSAQPLSSAPTSASSNLHMHHHLQCQPLPATAVQMQPSSFDGICQLPPSVYPGGSYPMQAIARPSFVPPQPYLQPAMPRVMAEFHFGGPAIDEWQGEWDDETGEYRDGGDLMYGNIEVKHRRRTTPDQLKVLEHWFDINPKPDNNLREWLASELGMTKRNVQVWFQNRRAKVKGLALKEKAAADKAARDAELKTTPERPESGRPQSSPGSQVSPGQQTLLPPVANVNMGRRASLPSGEAAKIEMWVAKRAAAGAGKELRPPGFVSPGRSPVIGQAAAARRASIPYPPPLLTQVDASVSGPSPVSPKISPSVRPKSSQLHLAAIRNNSRRASMPGAGAQLISSGPFTPPRVVSGTHPVPAGPGMSGRTTRELSPIKDHDGQGPDGRPAFSFGETDFTSTYLTPPDTSYMPSSVSPTSYISSDGTSLYEMFDPSSGATRTAPFTPNAPLPNPTFSFGDAAQFVPPPQMTDEEAARAQGLFMTMQQRGRIGSMASINTFTTDEGNTTENEEGANGEYLPGQLTPEGFHPDVRRASAPADVLQHLGFLGITTGPAMPIRPSPLGNHYTADSFAGTNVPLSTAQSLVPTFTSGTSDNSPVGTDPGSGSGASSEGPSPSAPRSQQYPPASASHLAVPRPDSQSISLSVINASSMPIHPPPPIRAHTMHFLTSATASSYADPFVPADAANRNSTSAPSSEVMSHAQPLLQVSFNGGMITPLESAFDDKNEFAYLGDGHDAVNILV